MKTAQNNFSPQSWRVRDAAALLLCLAGALVSLNLFRLDMFRTIGMQNLVPIGTITFKYKTAQRRSADRVIWDQLRQESPVYSRDTIRTAELSGAAIHFPGGAKIDLDENTLIQILTSNGRPRIDLEGGFMSLGGGSGDLVISAGGRLIEAAPGAVLSVRAGEGGMDLRVSEGTVLIGDSAGGSREAAAGTAISFDSSGLERAEPAAVVFAPRPNARLLNPRQEPLDTVFSWNRVNLSSDTLLRLEIAEDRNFSRIAQSIENAATMVRVPLPSGVWYWRIMHSNAVLAAGHLTVVHAPAPSLITPFDGEVFPYRSRQPSLRFQWARSADAVSWILEAADNPEFRNPRIRTQAHTPSLTTSELGAGLWYWRVLPVYGEEFEGTPRYSRTASFTIQQNGILEAPHPVSPASGATINIAAGRKDVYFSWQSENEAVSYTIRIAADRELRNPVIRETVREAFFVYGGRERILRAGQYYWGVSQTDATGSESPVSPARPLTALVGETIQRAVFPPDNFTIAETLLPDTRFTWKSNLPLETRFQISNSADFSRLTVNEIASGESFQGRSLPPGLWYWRISSEGEMDGQNRVFQTPARSFIAVPAFPAPLLAAPTPGERVTVREREPAVFRWQPVSGAEYYQFRVYAAANRSRPVYEQNFTPDTVQSLMLSNFPEGSYYWTVQAFARESPAASRRTGLIGGERFTIQKPPPLLPAAQYPVPVAQDALPVAQDTLLAAQDTLPEVQDVLPVAQDTLPEAQDMLLAVQDMLPEVQDTLSESQDALPVAQDTLLAAQDTLPEVQHPVSAAQDTLPTVQELLPADGHIVGPAELRQNRSLSFNWQPVKGANAYIFTLFKETDGRRQIVRIGPQERTSVTLEDLAILDRGDFVWQVEALSSTSGGVNERRSSIGESRFTVDIPLPQPVRGGTGILYGK